MIDANGKSGKIFCLKSTRRGRERKGERQGTCMPKVKRNKEYVELKVGQYALFFNRNYHLIYLTNEIMLGIWFVVGSVFFLWETTKTAGIILFIIGSLQLLIRPLLKIFHSMTLKKEEKSTQDH